MYSFNLSSIYVSTSSLKKVPNTVFLEDLQSLKLYLNDSFGISEDSYYLVSNGKKLYCLEDNPENYDMVIFVTPRILGGKGGFGSMLRAIGAQIEKTTNREACRDLSGRRLRDINEEQRLKNWIAQQAEREKEAAERKKKKLERLCQEPKHDFKDNQYEESRSNMTEVMSSSIEQGFKASTSGTASNNLKRKSKERISKEVNKKKKKTLWIDAEESDDSSNESNDSDGNECELVESKTSHDLTVTSEQSGIEDVGASP